MTESTPTSPPGPGDRRDDRQEAYDDMLESLDVAAEQCRYKLDGPGRIKDPQRENARANWVKALTGVVRERRQVLHARRLEDIAGDVEELKALLEDEP